MYKAADVQKVRGIPRAMHIRYEKSRQNTLKRMAALAVEMRRKVEVFLKINPGATMKQTDPFFMPNVRH